MWVQYPKNGEPKHNTRAFLFLIYYPRQHTFPCRFFLCPPFPFLFMGSYYFFISNSIIAPPTSQHTTSHESPFKFTILYIQPTSQRVSFRYNFALMCNRICIYGNKLTIRFEIDWNNWNRFYSRTVSIDLLLFATSLLLSKQRALLFLAHKLVFGTEVALDRSMARSPTTFLHSSTIRHPATQFVLFQKSAFLPLDKIEFAGALTG